MQPPACEGGNCRSPSFRIAKHRDGKASRKPGLRILDENQVLEVGESDEEPPNMLSGRAFVEIADVDLEHGTRKE